MSHYTRKSYRVAALCAAVFMLLLFILLGGLHLEHAGHECHPEQPCTICLQINQAIRKIRDTGMLAVGLVLSVFIFCTVTNLLECPEANIWANLTAVQLKIRMDH